jgi:hypothetical protein
MGPRPSDKHTLGRIDNNGDYCPENCRWELMKDQQRNKRSTRRIEHNGETKSLAEWSEITGLSGPTIMGRIRAGWPVKEALETPLLVSGPYSRKKGLKR